MLIKDKGLEFVFSCSVFVWLWYLNDAGLTECIRKCFYLFDLGWGVVGKIDISSSNVW